jgi:palmitoyltransferase
VTEEIDGAGAFCELCGVRQPRRCKHCHDCGRCVAVFDHHCAWLGNCVGARNRCV